MRRSSRVSVHWLRQGIDKLAAYFYLCIVRQTSKLLKWMHRYWDRSLTHHIHYRQWQVGRCPSPVHRSAGLGTVHMAGGRGLDKVQQQIETCSVQGEPRCTDSIVLEQATSHCWEVPRLSRVGRAARHQVSGPPSNHNTIGFFMLGDNRGQHPCRHDMSLL